MNPIQEKLLNKEWRIKNLYKIRNKEGQLIVFKRNRTQRHFNDNLHTRNLILKSRQLGFTTDEVIDGLDEVLFTPNRDMLLIAHNLEAGESIFSKKISFAWEKIHPQLKELYQVDTDTSKTLKFNFGKKGFSSIAVDTSGRSGTYHRVHIT
ncbi:MAG: terminase, partial [Nanoarchaeota archaeon]